MNHFTKAMLGLAMMAPGFAHADTIVARVNGKEIKSSELDALKAALPEKIVKGQDAKTLHIQMPTSMVLFQLSWITRTI
jgi:hypothetical protein